jgi:hypothetical protein
MTAAELAFPGVPGGFGGSYRVGLQFASVMMPLLDFGSTNLTVFATMARKGTLKLISCNDVAD